MYKLITIYVSYIPQVNCNLLEGRSYNSTNICQGKTQQNRLTVNAIVTKAGVLVDCGLHLTLLCTFYLRINTTSLYSMTKQSL